MTEFAVIPLSHCLRTKRLLSKLKGPFSNTQVNWLSSLNRNWNSPSPTSMILKSFPSFHTDRSSDFAALWLYGLLVRNLPNSVSEHSSIVSSLWAKFRFTTSPFSSVSCIFLASQWNLNPLCVFLEFHSAWAPWEERLTYSEREKLLCREEKKKTLMLWQCFLWRFPNN